MLSRSGPIVLTPGQVLIIDGSLVLDPGSVIEISVDDTQSPRILVNGDLMLGGQVILELQDAKDGETIPLFKADSVNGDVSSIIVKQPDECKRVKATPVKTGSSFSAMLSVESICSLNPWKIAAVVIACVLGIALLVAIGLIVLRRVRPDSSAFAYRSFDDESIR